MTEHRFPFNFSPEEKAQPIAIRDKRAGLTPEQKRKWLIVGGIAVAGLFLLSRLSRSGNQSQPAANAPRPPTFPVGTSPAVDIPELRGPMEPVTHRPVAMTPTVGVPLIETGIPPTVVKAPTWHAYYEGLMKNGSHQAVDVSLTFTKFTNNGDTINARIAVIGHAELSMTLAGSLHSKDKHAMTLEPEKWLVEAAGKHGVLLGHYPDLKLFLNADGTVTGYRSGSDSFRFTPVERPSTERTARPPTRPSTFDVTNSSALQGTYRLIRANGKTQPAETAPHRWVFDSDGKFRWLIGEAVFQQGTFRQSNPGHIEVTTEPGESLGIWKRHSNGQVEFCFSPPGQPRPKALQPNQRIGAIVYLAKPTSSGSD